jgi:hypothetical protein
VAADDLGCGSVNFGEEVLAQFPNAKAACRGVMKKGDTVYARYVAEVVSADKEAVTLILLGQDGKGVSKVTLAPTDADTVSMDGKDTKYSSLKKGDKIDMWVPHSRWGLYGKPGGPKMTIVSREQM